MRVAAAALACAFAAASFGTARAAEELPSADDLAARSRVATGADHRPDAERESWVVHSAGLDGTLDIVRRDNDSVKVTTLGPFRTERGNVRGEHWHQNENGQTILDRPEPSQVERMVAQSVARTREPVDAFVVTTTFASGHLTRTYYDPRTAYVVRTERVAAGHTTHVAFDDFRTDARGYTRAWHEAGGDERPGNAFDYRLVRDEIDADVADAELAIPHDRRALVEFPAGADVVRLPARIDGNRIYVRLQIGGRGLDFLLDTGAGSLTIDRGVAAELRLPVYGRTEQTVAGTFETNRVVVPEMRVGDVSMRDVVLRTAPFSSREAPGVRVVGLLGFDFLNAVALKIDYPAGTVDAIRPGTLVPPPNATALDVHLNSGTPVAHAVLGDSAGDDFILDTGAAFTYVVFQRFVRAHPDAIAQRGGTRPLAGSGVGGAMAYRPVTTKRLALGPTAFVDAAGAEALSPAALGFDNEDGLIGADILKQFTVYLDYASEHVFLVPRPAEPVAPRASKR